MVKIQPWRAIKTLFGYSSTGDKRQVIVPSTLKRLAQTIYTYGADPVSTWYSRNIQLAQDRFQLYREFDDMDCDDMCSAALDLYAEDASTPDPATGRRIWIEADDEEVEKIGNELLSRVNADEQVFSIAREVAKYGNSYSAPIQEQKNDGTPGEIIQFIPAPILGVSRIEDQEGRLVGFAMCPIEQLGSTIGISAPNDLSRGKPTDPPWAFIHFRLLGRERLESYGTSLLFPGRRPYRRLRMSEDALVIYRLKRSPDRFVFKVKGLGAMSPEDRLNAMRKIRQELRKKQLVNPESGQIRSELDPLGVDEDLIVDDEAVVVERLTGSAQVNHVLDIEYLRKRFFGSIKIPADYMGFSDAKSGFIAESPLSYQDINFARVIKRLQYAVMQGFALLIQINFCWNGIHPKSSKARFVVHMNPVSVLDEKNRLELEKTRAETLDVLQRVGQQLDLDSDDWYGYLLQKSQIPKHLLRKTQSDKPKDLLKGKVDVQGESAIDKAHLVESVTRRIASTQKLTGALKTQLTTILERGVILVEHRATVVDKKVSFHTSGKLVDLKTLFSPVASSNAFDSVNNLNQFTNTNIPLRTQDDQKQIVESANVVAWKSPEKIEEITATKNLMTETITTLKQKIETQKVDDGKKAKLFDKYGVADLTEFKFDEDEQEDNNEDDAD